MTYIYLKLPNKNYIYMYYLYNKEKYLLLKYPEDVMTVKQNFKIRQKIRKDKQTLG